MYITGRFVALLGLGVIPVIVLTQSLGGSLGAAWASVAGWVALCLVVAYVDVLAAANPTQVRLQRDLVRRVRLGETVTSSLTVRNTGRRLLRATIRDAWDPTAGAPEARLRANIPPAEARTVTTTLTPRRRGERRSAFVVIRSLGPLGFAGRQQRIDDPATIRVLPPFHARKHLASRVARLRELDGSTSIQVRGQGTEFDSLREYVRGDDVRSIDWRATARARNTMLRTWRPERDRHVVIVVDTGRTSAGRVGDETRLDAAMESALLLAALADRAGDNVHLLLFDRVIRGRVTGIRGPSLLPAMVDAMATVDAQLIDTDFQAALAEAARFTTRPSLVVVITALDAASASRGLLGALPPLARKSRVLLGSVTDVALSEIAADRSNSDAIWLAAAAERTMLDQRRLEDALARLGAHPVTAGPEELPPRVADRYLELKRAGLL